MKGVSSILKSLWLMHSKNERNTFNVVNVGDVSPVLE